MKLAFRAVSALALLASGATATPTSALTVFETVNLHMMMEMATTSLSVAAAGVEELNGSPGPLSVGRGKEVFQFAGTFSDANWAMTGTGKVRGQDFSIAMTGTQTGTYGGDLLLGVAGTATIAGNAMDVAASGAWKWNVGANNYDQFSMRQEVSTTEGFWTRLVRFVVKAAETVITIVAEEVVRVTVTGATSASGPVAVLVGVAVGDIINPVIEDVTKTVSNWILDPKYPDDGDDEEPEEPSYPEGPDGDGPGRRPIATIVNPDGILLMANNPGERLLGTAIVDGNRFSGSFAATIPEPSTWITMIGGFATVGVMMRRRRKRIENTTAQTER